MGNAAFTYGAGPAGGRAGERRAQKSAIDSWLARY